jgi:glycerol-3-phosphate acyltransferase PlsY
MSCFLSLLFLILSYLIGSIPFGLFIVRFRNGKDIRQVESGRTGGTNAMRAAGFQAGIITAILDFLKAACVVWLARWLAPGNIWLEVLSPVMAVIGHNYSIFLPERTSLKRWKLSGGAGGASTAGGAFGIWAPSIVIILPAALLIWFGIGYASLATMAVALLATITFVITTILGITPWQYIIYGILTEIILLWALRPNIQRLLKGTERITGWRARKRKIEQPT